MKRCAVSGWNVHISLSAAAAIGCLLAFTTPLAAQTSDGFDSMAQPQESAQACDAPRLPRDLHSFAYIRNGYREILRIIAVEHAIKAQFCGCQFDLVDWEDAVLAIDRFQTSDNPKLPFDVIALRRQADAAETTLKEACTE
ncbi:hypothetical protein WG622_16500 [Cognatishimia sp. D5M38]|uniref:Uncharacterized protein n=2 Tax=Rhodobacterales TaxID=204455 RepID=A0ABU8QKB2_9RHOB